MDLFNTNLSLFSRTVRRLPRIYLLYPLFLNAATNPDTKAVSPSTAEVKSATPNWSPISFAHFLIKYSVAVISSTFMRPIPILIRPSVFHVFDKK
jgi:hypothetical protein